MKSFYHSLNLSLIVLSLSWHLPVFVDAEDFKSELFPSTKLIYGDTFDGDLNRDFWEVRQSSTWVIKDGVLSGSQSTKAFQEQMIAKGDKAHAGFKPVIWLHKVPERFVCTMRIRYNGEVHTKGFPLIDIGHHIHTLTFSEKATTLTIKKDLEKEAVEAPLFSLNEWHDVAIEVNQGTLILTIDGKRHRFDSANINMSGHAQIDFKAIDFGTCQIDDVKVWEGLVK